MNKLIFTLCFTLLAFGAFSQTSIGRVYFDKDKSIVVLSEIDAINAKLKQLQFDTLFIQGRADIDGNNEYNYALSKQRVEAVKNVLILPKNAVVIESYLGENKPVNSQLNELEKTQNRFVELLISQKPVETLALLSPSEQADFDFHSKLRKLSTIYDSSEIQKVHGRTDSVIEFVGQKGIMVSIPSNFYFDSNYQPIQGKDVEIRFVEITTIADMILFNATTHSDGNLIETGGMIFIQAYVDGKAIKNFNPNKKSDITFTVPNEKADNMQQFDGVLTADRGVSWKPNPNSSNPNIQNALTKQLSAATEDLFYSHRNYSKTYLGRKRSKDDLKNDYLANSLVSKDVPDTVIKQVGVGSNLANSKIKLQVSELNWINCDRFLNSGIELMAMNYKSNYNSNIAIIPRIKSCLPGYVGDVFPNLPVNWTIGVVSFEVTDNFVEYVYVSTVTQPLVSTQLPPTKVSVEEFRKFIRSLN